METLELDIRLAGAELLSYSWAAPEMVAELDAISGEPYSAIRYEGALASVRGYLERCESVIERLELHLGFWNARLVWEDAALEAMSQVLMAIPESDARFGDLVRFNFLLLERRDTFCGVRDRYSGAVSHRSERFTMHLRCF